MSPVTVVTSQSLVGVQRTGQRAKMLKSFLTIPILLVISTAMVSSNTNNDDCAQGYTEIGDDCYKFIRTPQRRAQASTLCQSEGGKLVETLDSVHLNGVLRYVNNNHPGQFWVGGHLSNGRYKWEQSNQAIHSYMRGRRFGGTRGCVYMCSYTNKLWDGPCSHSKNFICQQPQVPQLPQPAAWGQPQPEQEIQDDTIIS